MALPIYTLTTLKTFEKAICKTIIVEESQNIHLHKKYLSRVPLYGRIIPLPDALTFKQKVSNVDYLTLNCWSVGPHRPSIQAAGIAFLSSLDVRTLWLETLHIRCRESKVELMWKFIPSGFHRARMCNTNC